MPLAFSMEEAGKGAKGLAEILNAVPAAQAQTSLLQTEAKLKGLELENILAAKEAATIPLPPSPIEKPSVQEQLYGNTVAAFSLQKDIASHRQQLQQAENALNSMPNPGTPAYRDQEAKVERMRKDLEASETKMISHQEKVGAANLLFLEGITNQSSLDGAHESLKEQLGQLFDEQSGVSPLDPAYENKKQAFIRSNDTLPKAYDPAGRSKLEMLKARSATSKDELELLKLRRAQRADELRLQGILYAAQARERSAARAQAAKGTDRHSKLIESARKANRDALDKNESQIKEVEAELKIMQDPLKYEIPKTTKGLFNDPNPAYQAYSDSVKKKEDTLELLKSHQQDLQREQENLKAQVEEEAGITPVEDLSDEALLKKYGQ